MSQQSQQITRVYFVRHAQPVHSHRDDRTRPLTREGLEDRFLAARLLREERIDAFYSSPYQRAVDTIAPTAEEYGMTIHTDDRFREREAGENGNVSDGFRRRWADHSWHEPGGESLEMVQHRNIQALQELLLANPGKRIVIGTHGTALSTILNYYRPEYGAADFLRIIDWMPWILEADFDGCRLIATRELGHIEKEFKG